MCRCYQVWVTGRKQSLSTALALMEENSLKLGSRSVCESLEWGGQSCSWRWNYLQTALSLPTHFTVLTVTKCRSTGRLLLKLGHVHCVCDALFRPLQWEGTYSSDLAPLVWVVSMDSNLITGKCHNRLIKLLKFTHREFRVTLSVCLRVWWLWLCS